MVTVATEQQKRIHPHKFNLWVGIASMLMMFAGLTSAYIIKRNQPGWEGFEVPKIFWFSTAVILLSSVTMQLAKNAFKANERSKYRNFITATFFLGVAFVVMQSAGFWQLWKSGLTLQKTVSLSFLYVIVGLHALHMLGGIIALLILFLKAFSSRVKTYNPVPVEVMATYWHFVDFLWLYLLFFLVVIK
jgi:cytochrome c oxidase subunit 3